MPSLLFNRNPLVLSGGIEQPLTQEIKSTPGLWNASLDDALRFGGDVTRSAVRAMNIRHDRRNIVVDVKVHMLMPGFMPAIPGYHTDGVPRGPELNPAGKGDPNIWAQTSRVERAPRYHLLITGTGCLTRFVTERVKLEVPKKPTPNLYKIITRQIKQLKPLTSLAPSCQVVEWDWWNLHTAVPATKHEWRYLIRVTETDHIEPQKDLREVLRTQQQVYVPAEFGW